MDGALKFTERLQADSFKKLRLRQKNLGKNNFAE